MKTIHAIITGRVQGVGFRWATRRKAQGLGLVGYVRNLTDGSVEVVAQGEALPMQNFMSWLEAGGPIGARVDNLRLIEQPDVETYTDFDVRY